MRWRPLLGTVLITAAGGLFAVGVARWGASPSARADDGPDSPAKQLRDKAADEPSPIRTMEGRIVDLCDYLGKEATPSPAADLRVPKLHKQKAAPTEKASKADQPARAFDGPIGLLIERPIPAADQPGAATRGLYLLIYTPGNREAYLSARTMIGQQVRLTGRAFDRDGLFAMDVQQVESLIPAPTPTAAVMPEKTK